MEDQASGAEQLPGLETPPRISRSPPGPPAHFHRSSATAGEEAGGHEQSSQEGPAPAVGAKDGAYTRESRTGIT